MADFANMLGSDEDSNEDIDHIPKTPGPPVITSDRDSDEDKSGDEKEEDVKKAVNESDSDSDSSSSPSDSSNEDIRQSRNDSEVERSDNENEEIHENRDTPKRVDTNVANDEMSSDNENVENEDKSVKESQNNDEEEDSDNEDIVRRKSPKKKRQLEEDSDSSDDERSDRNKKQRIESMNDNEDNEESDQNDGNEDKDEDMADKSAKATDIFGELSSEDEDEEEEKQKDEHKDEAMDSDKDSVNENKDNERRDEMSGDEDGVNKEGYGEQSFIEDEPQEEPIPETRIEVEIPRIVADLGTEVHFVKLPNFLSIDTHPYDPQWYEDEIDEDENLDDEGRARLKLKVENTIRWRNVVDRETNELKKESNTRVVKWSDGTFSLHLGEEIFDIHKLQLMTGDNNHLFIRQGTGLQGQTVFRTKLNFRPFSTESFTHRKLTLSLADRSQKTQKIRVLPNVGKDPEAHRTEMIKKEEDRLKASIRRENKQRRVRERSLVRGPTASYLEPDEDDEEGGISIARIKDQYKRGSFNKPYEDAEISDEESKPANDDDDSEDDLFDKKTEKKKSVHIVESDDE